MQTFLIADDSEAKVRYLKHMLKMIGFEGEVLVTHTTEGAMELIEQRPDISHAFVDYYIPSANGPAVIKYLHENIPSAKIALVSSADNEQNSKEAREAGAEEVLCTSDRADIVEKNIRDVLDMWLN